MNKPTLIILTKPPCIGVSKTRLAAEAGRATARRLSRAMTAHTMRQANHPAWRTRLLITPSKDTDKTLGGLWPPHFERYAQSGGGLGKRLAAAMKDAPPGPVIFIGTDAPGLSTSLLAEAARRLRRSDAVFGPARDGGFWLFGLDHRMRSAAVFDAVRWSSPHAMEDVWSNLPPRAKVSLLPDLVDIDTWKDWQLYKKQCRHCL